MVNKKTGIYFYSFDLILLYLLLVWNKSIMRKSAQMNVS